MWSFRKVCAILTVGFFVFASNNALVAAEIECENVDDNAVTFYSSDVSATKTESGKDCTVSVDGATASSRFPQMVSFVFSCSRTRAFRQRSEVVARELVPLMAGVSVPGFEFTPGGFPVIGPARTFERLESNCAQAIDSIRDPRGFGAQTDFVSQVHNSMDVFVFEEIANCLSNQTAGGRVGCTVDQETIQIIFRSELGVHTVQIPRLRF